MLFSIKLYIGIITSIYLVLSICVLFISLMQSVNAAQLFGFAAGSGTGAIVIVPLTSIYASL